eukprot:Lankesteria_metandrocarpae@DN3481_c0_g1_i4.p1
MHIQAVANSVWFYLGVRLDDESKWSTYFIHGSLLQDNPSSSKSSVTEYEPLYMVQRTSVPCCATVEDALVSEKFAALISPFDPSLLLIALLAADQPLARKFNSLSSVIAKHIGDEHLPVGRLMGLLAQHPAVLNTLRAVCDFETFDSTSYYKLNIAKLSSYLNKKVERLMDEAQRAELPLADCTSVTYLDQSQCGSEGPSENIQITYNKDLLKTSCWQLLSCSLSQPLQEEIAKYLCMEPWCIQQKEVDVALRKRPMPAPTTIVPPKRSADNQTERRMDQITNFFQKKQ